MNSWPGIYLTLVSKNDFKVKLTPIDDKPAYSQRHLAPLRPKGEIVVELAPLRKYCIITTLSFIQQICQPYRRSRETQWKTSTLSLLDKNQQPHI